jgi:hypothetical protein
VAEEYERRQHDPNDVRGGGGPPGPPQAWPTSKLNFGPLRKGDRPPGGPAPGTSTPARVEHRDEDS